MFRRSVDLLGRDGFERLQRALVVVLGLGGVGSHAAVALARAGVGRLRLVDCDDVTWSSLNRSAFATPDDIGLPKVEAAGRYLTHLCPELEVDARQAFYHRDTADALLQGGPDYVVDAIDSFTPKVALLQRCVEEGLPVVSCMGASSRTDPTRLCVADIHDTSICPLARAVRRGLRRFGIYRGVTCVYSTEPARPPLPPDSDEEMLQRGRRRRRQPSLSTLPGMFGYAAASLVIATLAGLEPER